MMAICAVSQSGAFSSADPAAQVECGPVAQVGGAQGEQDLIAAGDDALGILLEGVGEVGGVARRLLDRSPGADAGG